MKPVHEPPARPRSTDSVINRHLEHRLAGNLETDLTENYHSDVLLLSHEGVHRGHEGVRELASMLRRYAPERGYEVLQQTTAGRFGYLRWRVPGEIGDGVDTFVVEDGSIVSQSIHYTVA